MYGIGESDLSEQEWKKISEGLLKVANKEGIVDKKQREAINLQIKTQQYENTLKYIK